MNAIIKRIKMPVSCEKCHMAMYYINSGDTTCELTGEVLAKADENIRFTGRAKGCPLEIVDSNEDIISRKAALDVIEKGKSTDSFDADTAKAEIENIPPIAVRTGYWILDDIQNPEDVSNGNLRYICSKCGKSDTQAKGQKVPFCWWCGTNMLGKTTKELYSQGEKNE